MNVNQLLDIGDGIWELVATDGLELSLSELISLNKQGYILVSTYTDVDYEDVDEDGNTIQEYMHIYYFGKVNVKQFTELLDM